MRPAEALPRARGLVVAAVGVGLPVVGHVAAGGTVDVSPVALLPLGLAVTLCVTASAKTWTMLRLAVALVAVGLLVHGALWLGQVSQASSPLDATTTHHLGQAMAVGSGAHVTGHSMAMSTPMLLAHVAALVLSVWLLRRGETLLLWMWAQAQRLLSGPVFPAGCPHPPSPNSTATKPLDWTSLALVSGGPRAPPQLASI